MSTREAERLVVEILACELWTSALHRGLEQVLQQLAPAVRVVTCTELIKRLIAEGRASTTVTVVAVVRASALADPAAAADLPRVDQVALHTYE